MVAAKSCIFFLVCAVSASFPTELSHEEEVRSFISQVSLDRLREDLTILSTQTENRLYTDVNGLIGAQWIHDQAEVIARSSGRLGVDINVTYFEHDNWLQPSVIARVEGTVEPEHIIIVGGHEDSTSRSPGACDDGSGSVTLLEIFRVLAGGHFHPERSLEFQWYAAEEAGLLGSREMARYYSANQYDVKAMMQIDMDGHIEANAVTVVPSSMSGGDDELNDFLVLMIENYSGECCGNAGRLPWVFGSAGGGSDHSSWKAEGYKSCFGIENPKSPYLHTPQDTIDNISWEYLAAYTPIGVGFAVELSYTDWEADTNSYEPPAIIEKEWRGNVWVGDLA
eukprot:Lithocolla_globosa_v1_NODE_6378_length_1095_cov_65.462500.p1 type:complete len:338 gc:universal NODE_6378_length_1095_cov_65.462500:1055-42(-)